MVSKETAVTVLMGEITLPETANVSLPTFLNIVQKLELSQRDVSTLVEMVTIHHVSVPYVGKLLGAGINLRHIRAAYLLRDKLEPLYDPNTSMGSKTSEFALPVDKACEFLAKLYGNEECYDDEYIEAAARLLSDVAERCPQIQTWSSILDIMADVQESLERALEARVGDLLDLPPDEKVEMMIDVINETQLIADRRL